MSVCDPVLSVLDGDGRRLVSERGLTRPCSHLDDDVSHWLFQHDLVHCHVFNPGGLEPKRCHWCAGPSTSTTWMSSNIWTAPTAAVAPTCFVSMGFSVGNCHLFIMFPLIAVSVKWCMLYMARHQERGWLADYNIQKFGGGAKSPGVSRCLP